MANPEHLAILKDAIDKGDISIWNQWRENNDVARPDLREVDLRRANLGEIDLNAARLSHANLSGANLSKADLYEADLTYANLTKANLCEAHLGLAEAGYANLSEANLTQAVLDCSMYGANLSKANCFKAHLSFTDLNNADLTETDFTKSSLSYVNFKNALLIKTDFSEAKLHDCRIFGSLVRDIKLESAVQHDFNISPHRFPAITVDYLQIARFLSNYLFHSVVNDAVDTIKLKATLVLGRFLPPRLIVLNTIREHLRNSGFIPIFMDFHNSESHDLTETVCTLAHLSRFVIADLTDPSSIPHELANIVPQLPSVPVKPIILAGKRKYGMIEHLYRYPWVLPAHEYDSQETLLADLADKVIQPAQDKAEELKKEN